MVAIQETKLVAERTPSVVSHQEKDGWALAAVEGTCLEERAAQATQRNMSAGVAVAVPKSVGVAYVDGTVSFDAPPLKASLGASHRCGSTS